jgi:hypothetical protein
MLPFPTEPEESMSSQRVRQAAEELADSHRQEDPATEEIYFAFDERRDEIQLIEISSSVGESGEVMPFRFSAQDDIPFATVLVLLSPKEWEQLQWGGEIEWPDKLKSIDEFTRIPA